VQARAPAFGGEDAQVDLLVVVEQHLHAALATHEHARHSGKGHGARCDRARIVGRHEQIEIAAHRFAAAHASGHGDAADARHGGEAVCQRGSDASGLDPWPPAAAHGPVLLDRLQQAMDARGSHPRKAQQPPVPGRCFELRHGADAQGCPYGADRRSADAADLQHLDEAGRKFLHQSIAIVAGTGPQDLLDAVDDPFADPRDRAQPAHAEQGVGGLWQAVNDLRGVPEGAHAVLVAAAHVQQVRDMFEHGRDVCVGQGRASGRAGHRCRASSAAC
jgi:hypothetical protein